MAYNPNPSQRSTGPGRGQGPGGSGPKAAPTSKALESFTQHLSKGASFADDSIMGLVEDLARDLEGGFRSESGRTQVRKLYGEFQAIRKKAKAGFDAIRPELRLIQAHVAYAVARPTLTQQFKVFADEAIKHLLNAKNTDGLDQFVKFFEALYAHFYYFSKMSRKEG